MKFKQAQKFLKQLEGKNVTIKTVSNEDNHYRGIDKIIIEYDGEEYLLIAASHESAVINVEKLEGE